MRKKSQMKKLSNKSRNLRRKKKKRKRGEDEIN